MNKDFVLVDTHLHPSIIKTLMGANDDIVIYTNNIIIESSKNLVSKVICISTDAKDLYENIKIANLVPNAYASLGIHPCEANHNDCQQEIKLLKNALSAHCNNKKIVAIGETGIDLHHNKERLHAQEKLFREHIHLSIEYKLPLIIHSRKAYQETLKILDEYHTEKLKGVIHAFDGNYLDAQEWITRGFMLGVGGIVTYPKNTFLRDALLQIGWDHIILETDAPFLPPQGFRGSINHPRHILTIAEYISHMLGIKFEDFARRIYENTIKIFPKIQ